MQIIYSSDPHISLQGWLTLPFYTNMVLKNHYLGKYQVLFTIPKGEQVYIDGICYHGGVIATGVFRGNFKFYF